MPTRKTKVRVCFVPLLAGGFAFASAMVKDMRPVELLAIYTLGLLGMVLGVLGRQKELARLALDQERNGKTADNQAPSAWSPSSSSRSSPWAGSRSTSTESDH
ncbi:hypothetical protein ACWEP4_36065 [Streptomyces sp. NPDC004227]